MAKQVKKITPTAAELANDPSLRFCPYRQWELVWCDERDECVRFHHYADVARTIVVVASVHMAVLPGSVPAASLRRPSTMPEYLTPNKNYLAGNRQT